MDRGGKNSYKRLAICQNIRHQGVLMKSIRLWKLLLVSVFAMFVVACKPFASFTVSPDPVVAGQVATFDASASSVGPKPKNNAAVSYAWDFGDGTTGTGKVATHTFAAAGTYTVKLSVTDKAGRVGTSVDKVKVKAGDDPTTGTTVPLNLTVRGADGALLAGAQVTLGSLSVNTNNAGVASVAQAPAGAGRVLRVSKAGFVTQVLNLDLVAGTTPQEVGVRLLAVKETIAIAQAEVAQVLLANSLGASVTLPANALVNLVKNHQGLGLIGAARQGCLQRQSKPGQFAARRNHAQSAKRRTRIGHDLKLDPVHARWPGAFRRQGLYRDPKPRLVQLERRKLGLYRKGKHLGGLVAAGGQVSGRDQIVFPRLIGLSLGGLERLIGRFDGGKGLGNLDPGGGQALDRHIQLARHGS
jgi:hypothetical protein